MQFTRYTRSLFSIAYCDRVIDSDARTVLQPYAILPLSSLKACQNLLLWWWWWWWWWRWRLFALLLATRVFSCRYNYNITHPGREKERVRREKRSLIMHIRVWLQEAHQLLLLLLLPTVKLDRCVKFGMRASCFNLHGIYTWWHCSSS